MRSVFFGTPDIAVPALEALSSLSEVVAVVCQPDRPAGRGLKLRPPPVKIAAETLGLPVVQPTRLKSGDFARWLVAQRADVALVIAYGRILPKPVLEAPRLGCVNLHASILPKYRGAAPIHWAVVNGERETGISLMQMDEGCDTGPVLAIHRLAIGRDETTGELHERLAALAAEVVRAELPRFFRGELVPRPQDEAAASQAPLLRREDGRIDWTAPAHVIHDLVRGLCPWPGAHARLEGKLFKVLRSDWSDEASDAPSGTILRIDGAAVVATGAGVLRIITGQLEGKKALSARELASGRSLAPGLRFS